MKKPVAKAKATGKKGPGPQEDMVERFLQQQWGIGARHPAYHSLITSERTKAMAARAGAQRGGEDDGLS